MNCPWCNGEILKQWVNSWLRWESHRIKRIPCLMRENFMILKLRAALERPTLPVHPQQIRVTELCLAAILDCRLKHSIWWVSPETFLNDYLLEKDNLKISRKITEFGIFFSWCEPKTYRTYDDNRIEEETWATSLIQIEKHSPLWSWYFTSYWWNLFSRWYDGVTEISNLGAASCKIPGLHGFWKLESQFQDWSLREDSESSNHDVMDHRSWESKVNWRIEYIAINFWENRFPRLWNAGCNDSVCIEEYSQLAHSILEKNMCRRATCSKIRPILTKRTNFVHDLWAFSCTQSLWIGTRTLRLVHFSSPEWWCPRFSMSDGIRHYYQQMNHLLKRSWKDCRSQN